MVLAPAVADAAVTAAERRKSGQALRQRVPRRAHAAWSASPGRADPVRIIIESGRHLIQRLLPVRYGRMRASPLAYFRGAAAVMASDLDATPASGLVVQACGDCHLANFGPYAAINGSMVFDIGDFDESLAAPFEWDLKRLAASFAVAARTLRMPDRRAFGLAGSACRAYRERLAELGRMEPLQAWRGQIDIGQTLATAIGDGKLRAREVKRLEAAASASRAAYPKFVERRDGSWRIRIMPPYTAPLSERDDSTLEVAAHTAFHSYRASLREEQRLLLDRYRLADLAFKVAGVAGVGAFCAIALLITADGDSLLLQIKEARRSVLAPFAGASPYSNQGRRIAVGQRIMQATADPFLGWTDDVGDDRPCYVRMLRDPRMALTGETLTDGVLDCHAALCGRALARAHARSQDAARLAGYMGSSGAFDAAIAEFAMRYADQTERDYKAFLDAIESGLIEAAAP